jgi:hypothetical protein
VRASRFSSAALREGSNVTTERPRCCGITWGALAPRAAKFDRALFNILCTDSDGACERTLLRATRRLAQSVSERSEAGSISFASRSLAEVSMEFRALSSCRSCVFTVVNPVIAVCSSRAVLVEEIAAS